ncbi:MAG TPA: GNAT family N-acetyltransferase [Candidatus Thermoplasmatota archaeon]|nr:GNAT family N-acetyltransferase [Candidatus Thermoplasmatota archaeon]
MSQTLRAAGAADLDALLPLLAEFHAHEQLPTTPTGRRAALERLLREGQRGRVVLAEQEGGPIGYGIVALGYSIEFGGIDGFVDELYVRVPHRGKGLGSRLLDALEAEATRAGAVAVHLEVDDGNERARQLYLRRGYRQHRRRLMTRKIGD